MLPHVARRPITLVRCPTGRQSKCFYQRHAGSGVPAELGEVDIPGFEELGAYLFIKDAARPRRARADGRRSRSIPGASRVDKPDRPDRIIFDLDPGEGLGFGTWSRGGARGAGAPRRPRPRRASSRPPAARACTSCVPIDRRHGYPTGEGLRQEGGREPRGEDADALSDPHLEGRAPRPHLHRLPAQRRDLDRGRAPTRPARAPARRSRRR